MKWVYVSHWFDSLRYGDEQPARTEKYLNTAYLAWLKSKGFRIVSISHECTHHDAHAWSAVAFFENHTNTNANPELSAHIIVGDGFGTAQEVFSVYKVGWAGGVARITCLNRMWGYANSLGLMYQYATSFCGMKEHQDEYKFLGYESCIMAVAEDLHFDHRKIDTLAAEKAAKLFAEFADVPLNRSTPDETFINLDELTAAKSRWVAHFEDVLAAIGMTGVPMHPRRVIIGYYIQAVLEYFYARVIKAFDVTNLLLTGGIHYNVKLNNACAQLVPGMVSIVPLAGDQGAAIGLHRAYQGPFFPFKSLLWGKRDLRLNGTKMPDGARHATNRDDYVDTIVTALKDNQLVNTITGAMEFGPRALCNTSTLAMPNEENVSTINAINGRDTVMPFAGVMLAGDVGTFHHAEHARKIVGSLHYMITTLDYKEGLGPEYRGIAHKHPTEARFTGRPQVIDYGNQAPIEDILRGVGPTTQALINTSLNVHGVPIVFTLKDAINDFAFNVNEAATLGQRKPILVIGDF